MNIKELQAEVNAIHQIYAQIESGAAQDIIKKLLNLIERVASNNKSLEVEIQHLRDEVNRLKGEQGKPDIRPNKKTRNRQIFRPKKNAKKQKRTRIKTKAQRTRRSALESPSFQR